MPENPFQYGSIVNRDDFCSRSELSRRLETHFKNGQNVAVLGPRRVGKSSLIHHAAGRIKNSTFLYSDLWGIHGFGDFLRRCLHALDAIEDKATLIQKISRILPGLTVTLGTDPISGLPTLTPAFNERKRDFPDSISRLAKLWSSLREGKGKLIVALDEFQDAAHMEEGEQVLGALRKEIQLLGNIAFCFCGSIRSDMWRIFAEDRGVFYKSSAILEVSATDFDDWPGFLRGKFARTKIRIDEESLDEIISIAGGNPGDTQQLCSSVWEQARFQNRRKIDQELIKEGLLQVFADEKKGYEQIIADVSGQQLAVLRSIARLGGESVQSADFLYDSGIVHASSAKAAATRLEQRRVLQKSPGGFEFSNPFFKEWLLHVRY